MCNSENYIKKLVDKARVAQSEIEKYDQKRIDELCEVVSYGCILEDFRRKVAHILSQESQMGNEEDKAQKIKNKSMSVYQEMKGERSVGIIKEDKENGLVTYIKPIGVIAAIIPVTNGESTPIVKALWAIKSRNALIISPHHRGVKTAKFIVEYIRKILKAYNAPEDWIQYIDNEHINRETTRELMRQSDFIVATGGNGLVRAAYSSGTPAIGVGGGNATVYVDDSADIDIVAEKLRISQIFDYSSSCSSESNILCHEEIYNDFIEACKEHGAYFISNDSLEKEKLKKTIWPSWPDNDSINRDISAKSPYFIGKKAGIDISENTSFILLEESEGCGREYVTTGEKLCPVITLIKVKGIEDAISKTKQILQYQGNGHSCGIHTNREEQINTFAESITVSRILVNQSQSMGNAGAYFNGMPSTNSLGCGTWGGNSSCENITWKNLTNTTTVSRIIKRNKPLKEEEVYSKELLENGIKE